MLVVQATGWGKSAVYWAATAIRRAEGVGPTLVVSPLLSLMRDQVAAAGRAGLRAATLNSSNIDEWSAVEDGARGRARSTCCWSRPSGWPTPASAAGCSTGSPATSACSSIDEAHAVSDWGHDFRPDYRRVSDVLQRLNPQTPVLATTATANARVTDDVARQLGETTLVLRGPLARASLELSVVDRLSPLERYAWVVDHLPRLPGSGIVYALTVADAERLAAAVREVHGADVPGRGVHRAARGRASASRLEDALRDNRLKALIATSALGMGYDKPDLGFVVHVGAPPSPVSYYQQVGRAGRAIDHALVVLLPSDADAGVWDYFATATIPEPEQVSAGARRWSRTGEAGERGRARGGDRGPPRSGGADAQAARRGRRGRPGRGRLDRHRACRGTYDAEHYDGIVAVRRREADIMRAYTRGRGA